MWIVEVVKLRVVSVACMRAIMGRKGVEERLRRRQTGFKTRLRCLLLSVEELRSVRRERRRHRWRMSAWGTEDDVEIVQDRQCVRERRKKKVGACMGGM